MLLGLSLAGRPHGSPPVFSAPAGTTEVTPDTAPPAAAPAHDGVSLSTPPSSATSAEPTATSPRGILDRLRQAADQVAHHVASSLAGARLVGYGLVYKLEGRLTETRELLYQPSASLPTPTITRPFVLAPGWTTTHRNFADLTDLLTRDGSNGGQTYFVQQGRFYTRDVDGALQPLPAPPTGGKVFEMVWTDTRNSPDENLSEMRQNLDAICSATGYDKVDVEGFSLGGLHSRLYLDQGGDRIHRLMMLGTPNHGTRFAELVLDVLDRDVTWAERVSGVSEDDRNAMKWLRAEPNSAELQDLNSRAAQQLRNVPTISVGTDVMPTPGFSWGFTWGDGLVPSTSLPVDGATTIVLHEAMQHGRLNDDATTQHIRAVFFGWGLSPQDEAMFPEDTEIIARVPRPPAAPPTPTASTVTAA